jgi:hypothetical protein
MRSLHFDIRCRSTTPVVAAEFLEYAPELAHRFRMQIDSHVDLG